MANVGSSVGMTYSDQESGATTTSIAPAFINSFGYQSALLNNYTYNNLVININSNEPVILTGFANNTTTGWWFWRTDHYGSGHAWVCDGYQHTTWYQCDYGGGYYDYLHMNWGWNEVFTNNNNYNGWYNESNWTVARSDATLNFQYNKQMVYNIHPYF